MVTEGRVKEMIDAAVDQVRGELGTLVQQKLEEQSEDIRTAREALVRVAQTAEGKLTEGENRINGLIVQYNGVFARHQEEFAKHQSVIEGIAAASEVKFKELEASTNDLELHMNEAKVDAQKLSAGVDEFANSQRESMEKVKSDCGVAIKEFENKVGECAQRLKQEMGTAQPGTSGGSGPGGHGKLSVDKKEISVWKLADSATRPDFRHWCDTIDSNLDAVHHLPYPEILLDKVRRSKTEINATNWPIIIGLANERSPPTRSFSVLEASLPGWQVRTMRLARTLWRRQR